MIKAGTLSLGMAGGDGMPVGTPWLCLLLMKCSEQITRWHLFKKQDYLCSASSEETSISVHKIYSQLRFRSHIGTVVKPK